MKHITVERFRELIKGKEFIQLWDTGQFEYIDFASMRIDSKGVYCVSLEWGPERGIKTLFESKPSKYDDLKEMIKHKKRCTMDDADEFLDGIETVEDMITKLESEDK